MSMVLNFLTSEGAGISKGPFASVHLDGEIIRGSAGGDAIAEHLPYGWKVDGRVYLRLDIDVSVVVHWLGCPAGGTRGTTGRFSSVDGVAYMDRRILAFVDRERQDWYLLRQGLHTPCLVLEPEQKERPGG